MDLEKSESNVNFVPCLTWVRRGVAKPNPERLKLTAEELSQVIKETKQSIIEQEETAGDSEPEKENIDISDSIEVKSEFKKEPKIEKEFVEPVKMEKTEDDIAAEYGLDDYDEEEDGSNNMLGLGDLTSFADPSEDPYLSTMDREIGEDDQEDLEDFQIRGTDNLIVCGHVEGDSSSLEVYVYNDVEDALYVHHDILLPSFPLALEWLSFDPESDTRGSLVAVGSMEPVIQVWDLDLVDCLEPAFKLGRKAKKKKKIPGVGHTDAVLALSWNSLCDHVLASGSVDQTVLLWDLTTQQVASKLGKHKEKVQSLAFHPLEAHSLVTGCCDGLVRLFDCRAPDSCKSWGVGGEIERVVWDHFNPFKCLAATDSGSVHYMDVRQEKPIWTLSAHSEAVTGLTLSPQVPGLVTTVSSDGALKVWDIAGDQPAFVTEREMKLGQLQVLASCPDAPFVVCMGGDKSSDNFKVMDVRDSLQVRQRFGKRNLQNPLKTSDFGFATADEAENTEDMETEATTLNLQSMSLHSSDPSAGPVVIPELNKPTGGAASKFSKKKKEEKKAKKKKKML